MKSSNVMDSSDADSDNSTDYDDDDEDNDSEDDSSEGKQKQINTAKPEEAPKKVSTFGALLKQSDRIYWIIILPDLFT